MAVITAGIISGAAVGATVNYKVDPDFNIKVGTTEYLTSMSNGDLCALVRDKHGHQTIKLINAEGKDVGGFKLDSGPRSSTVAVDKNDGIYLFFPELKEEVYTYRGRKHKRMMPVSLNYKVYDKTGKELKQGKLDAVKKANSAALLSDGTLVIADDSQRAIFFLDPATGKVKHKISRGIRLCCGIFDFCVEPGDSILLANLAAFKVQQYDKTGKPTWNFGKRGRKTDDFQGCCNPVSVCRLQNGAIVTAEKSPTRIKVYDAKGKKAALIQGVRELVKGCYYIPMVADKEDRVYLAAPTKGLIIRCVPVEGVKDDAGSQEASATGQE